MKKTKVYRPRRGLRFSNGPKGVSPQASFVGGPPITRTRPTRSKVNLTTKKTDTLTVSGSVMTSAIGVNGTYADPSEPTVLTSSIYIDGSISYGQQYERKKYNAILLGLPKNSVDRAPYPSITVVDSASPTGAVTGTFESPSWTHKSIGFNQAFVGVVLTSSYVYDQVTHNLFRSGTQAVENTPVPASATLFSAKTSKYNTIVVKHTASFFDTVVPSLPGTSTPMSGVHVPATFVALTGTYLNTVTGTNGQHKCQATAPATIMVNVPVSGRLVDIKVWVEVVQVSGSARMFPLGVFGIALRSPNVTWGIAHPLPNDSQMFPILPGVQFREQSGEIWDFYRDSFILWEGGNMFGDDTGPGNGTVNNGGIAAGTFKGAFDTRHYPTWQNDRCIRTIFADGAPVPNPRHLYSSTSPSGNFVGAPNAYNGTGSNDALNRNNAYGSDVPWVSDQTVQGISGTSFGQNGSPPAGWLTAPGGIAGPNEWPTTGFNFGAPSIRPLYPVLDPIYGRKVIGSEGIWNGQDFIDTTLFRGGRPGLRGTEISGTWQILFVNNINGNTTIYSSTASMDAYFRQARLEITYEAPVSADPVLRRSDSKFRARRGGERLLYTISGSSKSGFDGLFVSGGADYFVNQVLVSTPFQAEVGRTFGLKLNSGSVVQGDSALFYRLSGTLADTFGPAPSWLTQNFFGMPLIPMSSASLSPPNPSASIGDIPPVATVISPQKTLDGARLLTTVATDFNPPKTLIKLAAGFVSSSTR